MSTRSTKGFSSARAAGFVPAVADTPPPPQSSPARLLPATRGGRWSVLGIAVVLAITITTVLNAMWDTPPPANRPIKVPVNDYVSADSCRSCHPGNYASWHTSFHRTMTQVAKRENFAADMDGLELSYAKTDYRVERKGDTYRVLTKPTGTPASAYGDPRDIVLLTGSHNFQVCWVETTDKQGGRKLGQFPFGYIIADKIWTPMTQTFLAPPNIESYYSDGDWNNGCINCHTTNGRSRPTPAGGYDSEVSDFGISCESCHSGGKEHIAANRNPLRRFGLHLSDKGDKTIANPAKMDGPAASLACGQCHSFWAFDSNDTSVWDQHGAKFRPGMKELDQRWVTQPHSTIHPERLEKMVQANPHRFDNSFWSDGLVRITGREYNGIIMSPCYKGGHFSCVSCHEMHPADTSPANLKEWRSTGQTKPGMRGDQACTQCHGNIQANLPAHTHHAAGSPGSSCLNCHMPHTTYGLLRSLRAHTITSPNVEESVKVGRPNACNLCHLDRSLGWTAGKLAEWYGQQSPALDREQKELSAAVVWALKGDAGQRMLIAWSMGWEPAQLASGRDWLYPYLIMELNDPYAAIRYGAWKSLRTLPGFEDFPMDYNADEAALDEVFGRAYQKWGTEVRKPAGSYPAGTLLRPDGTFVQPEFQQMFDQRNKRSLLLVE